MNNDKLNTIQHLSTYGLAIFLFLTPFEYPLADLFAISPLRIIGLFAMGLALLDIIHDRSFFVDYRFILIALWLLYGFFTIVWTLDEERFQTFYSLYFNNGIMFLLFAMISFNKTEVVFLKKAIVAGVGVLLLYMTFVPNAVIYSGYQHRLTLNAGKGGLDQNYLAALMVVAFGLVIYKALNSDLKTPNKLFCFSYCVFVAYYIVLTGSRSGLIAISLIVLLNVNTSWKNRLMVGIPILILISVGLPLITRFIPIDLLDRFSISALTGNEAESGTRLIIWKTALSSLNGLWWLCGHGVGSSQTVVGNAIGIGKDMAIHNHYIAMITEVGILGFLMINMPIIKMLRSLWQSEKDIVISVLGIAVMALFLDVVTTKFFWAALLILNACYSSRKNDLFALEGRL